MDLLSLFSGCALIISAQCSPSATPAHPQKGVAQWQPMVAKAASTFALPEAWLNAVMARESGGKTMLNGKPITSAAGAMGLMQVMPRTYSDLRKQLGLGADPYAPADNITAGAAYLQQMYRRYGYPGMFAAYNAGPGRFDDYSAAATPASQRDFGLCRQDRAGCGDGFFQRWTALYWPDSSRGYATLAGTFRDAFRVPRTRTAHSLCRCPSPITEGFSP